MDQAPTIDSAPVSVAETRFGPMRYFTNDEPIGRSLREFGEWAECELKLIRSFISEGDVVIDAGANLGTHAVALARHVGMDGVVLAFEPQGEVFKLLEANLVSTGSHNVRAYHAALGETAGYCTVPKLDYARNANFGAVTIQDTEGHEVGSRIEVPRLTLDSFDLQRCDFLKLDTEGVELSVLKGARDMLVRLRPRLYLECNAIEKGLETILFLTELGYRPFFCRTDAFNEQNFVGSPANFFGSAQESSLLFLHGSDDAMLKKAAAMGLPVVQDKASLVDLFASTPRYGDVLGNETKEWLRLKAPTGPKLSHPLTVIIPVYNAPKSLEALVDSLASSVPEPIDRLSFTFTDDCSTDELVDAVYSNLFFQRPDVRLVRNRKNMGFVGNINQAIEATPVDHDVLLLNSDTEVWSEIFSVLQREAYAEPNIATVTPLTNNGTIASLFNFPDGSGLPRALGGQALAEAAQKLDLPTPTVPAPTGIGFCLYLKRSALNDVGLLDPDYGRGYGEECDWCRRAIARGWKHLISPKAFVVHEGTQSFDVEAKQSLLASNSQILISRYPDYDRDVLDYIGRDPLKFERIALLLSAVRATGVCHSTYLMTVHADPSNFHAGGTERHVRFLRQMLDDKGHLVLELYPTTGGRFGFRAFRSGQTLVEETIHYALLPTFIHFLESFVDTLHVHHVLGWPEEAIRALRDGKFAHKLFTAHDFFSLCPTITLQRTADTRFCSVEPDRSACNDCLQRVPGYAGADIESYRSRSLALLGAFDALLFPSPVLIDYFATAFGAAFEPLRAKAHVVEHDLSQVIELARRQDEAVAESQPKTVAFIGVLGIHKGRHVLLDAIPRLQALGYRVEILGLIHPHPGAVLAEVHITHFSTPAELQALLRERRPEIVAFPVIWAETFCYTFYEAVLLSPGSIPVVGPYGNPARVVREAKLGVVMREASAEALVQACLEATDRRSEFEPRLQAFNTELQGQKRSYYEEFIGIEHVLARPGWTQARPFARAHDPATLRQIEMAARERDHLLGELHGLYLERDTVAFRAARKLQAILRRYPSIKGYLLRTIRLLWRVLKAGRRLAQTGLAPLR